MTAIDRRAMLGTLLGAAAMAAFGFALKPGSAESAPLTIDKGLIAPAENLVENDVVVVHRRRGWRGHRRVVVHRRGWGWHGHRRYGGWHGRRRRVCWWHRGRRICRWRW